MKRPEDRLTKACFQYMNTVLNRQQIRLFFHVANERKVKRKMIRGRPVPVEGNKLKSMGVQSGTSDFIYLKPKVIPANDYMAFMKQMASVLEVNKSRMIKHHPYDITGIHTGTHFIIPHLCIELKCGYNKPTESQEEFLMAVDDAGGLSVVIYDDVQVFINVINTYHNKPINKPNNTIKL